jgi:SAM-dependent methyltransferase
MKNSGVLNETYHTKRIKEKAPKYRLNRRANEVIKTIDNFFSTTPKHIIDLGTADGLILSKIKNHFPKSKCIGIEFSWELVGCNRDSRNIILQGDVNLLPLKDNFFDVAIATAVIEHLPNPKQMLEESKRILKSNGLIILTCPDPFWERVATIVGHLPPEQHHKVMNQKAIKCLFEKVGYEVLEQKKFMLSPVGTPYEIPIENIVRTIGLNFLFANQLIVGRKKDDH